MSVKSVAVIAGLFAGDAAMCLAEITITPAIFPDATICRLSAINNQGFALGVAGVGGGDSLFPFSWSMQTGVVPIPSLGVPMSFGDVNESGVANAQRVLQASPLILNALRWSASGGFVELPRIGTLPSSHVSRAINEAGDIVGRNDVAGGSSAAAVAWPAAGGVVDLGSFGGTVSAAQGINDSGLIVGRSRDATGVTRAFKTTIGQPLTMLPSLAADGSATAMAVNNSGTIFGTAPALDNREIQIWYPDGSSQLIPRTAGFADIQFATANNNNEAVGLLEDATSSFYAMYYSAATGMIELHTLLSAEDQEKWQLFTADDINDNGWIVGSGRYDADGPLGIEPPIIAGFVMQVPEPQSAIFLAAAGCIIRRARRLGRTYAR